MHLDDTAAKLLDHATLYGCALLGSWLRARHIRTAAVASVAILSARLELVEKFLHEHFHFGQG